MNLGLAAVLVARRHGRRSASALGDGRGRRVRSLAIVVSVSLVSPAHRFVDPSVARIHATQRTLFAADEDEIASVQAGQSRSASSSASTGTAMTLLTVDAKLMPILPLMLRPDSTRPRPSRSGWARRSGPVIAGLQTDAVELVPSVPKMFRWFYPDADAILAEPERPRHRDRRPEPPRADAEALRHHRHRPAAADRELRRRGHLVARVLPGRRRPPEPGRRDDAVDPYGGTVDEFLDHIRTFHAVFPHVIVAFGPGGYGFFLIGSDQPIQFTDENIRNVLARPGSWRTSRRPTTRPRTTVDGWATKIRSSIWIQGDQVEQRRRRRPADHRRPAAARVLAAPPAVLRPLAEAVAERAVQAVVGAGQPSTGRWRRHRSGAGRPLSRGPARLGRPSGSRGAHGPTNANTPSQTVRNDHS